MTGAGFIPYDLAAAFCCEECGHPKSYRMWPGLLTGCATCDEVVTRHRCTQSGRPELDGLALGASWDCPHRGTVWTATEKEETCGECGQGVGTMRRAWHSDPGDRIDTAPRHDPQPYTPLRNTLPGSTR